MEIETKFNIGEKVIYYGEEGAIFTITIENDNSIKYIIKLEDELRSVSEDELKLVPKGPILTDEEKQYLENVLRPFKDKVEGIIKVTKFAKEYILIELSVDSAYLPNFSNGKYYKGMKSFTKYTLKELGLFEGE